MHVFVQKGYEVAERRAQELRKAELAFWEGEAHKWRDALEAIHRELSYGKVVEIDLDRVMIKAVRQLDVGLEDEPETDVV